MDRSSLTLTHSYSLSEAMGLLFFLDLQYRKVTERRACTPEMLQPPGGHDGDGR